MMPDTKIYLFAQTYSDLFGVKEILKISNYGFIALQGLNNKFLCNPV